MYTLMNLHICMGFVRKEQGYFLLAGIMSFSFMEYNVFFFKDMKSKASCQRQLCVVAGLIFLENFAMGYFEKYVAVEGAEQRICFT